MTHFNDVSTWSALQNSTDSRYPTINSTLVTNSTSNSTVCTLSGSGHATGALYTAIVGSVVAGITGGSWLVLVLALHCYLSTLRILVVAVWQVGRVLQVQPFYDVERISELLYPWSGPRSQSAHGTAGIVQNEASGHTYLLSPIASREGGPPGPQSHAMRPEASSIPSLRDLASSLQDLVSSSREASSLRDLADNESSLRSLEQTRTSQTSVLGWIGWTYGNCYAPVVQILWLVENWNEASFLLLLARSTAVSIIALPSTLDTRARYSKVLRERYDWRAEFLFTVITTIGTLTLGTVAMTEIILGLAAYLHIPAAAGIRGGWAGATLLFTLFSLVKFKPRDRPIQMNGSQIFHGIWTGWFCGGFCTIPLYLLFRDPPPGYDDGQSLKVFLKCESVSFWRKLSAVLP